jgi:Ca2+-transporting ATPase
LLWINLGTDGLPALALATDAVDPDVMQQQPRARSERITNQSFLGTMLFTGFLTAAVAFGVFVYDLRTESLEEARGSAFAVLVFAELFRAFGARSESKPIWLIAVFSIVNLVMVVCVSIGLQVWSQHSTSLGGFLKTPPMTYTECLRLIALGTIPLAILEGAKIIRHIYRGIKK